MEPKARRFALAITGCLLLWATGCRSLQVDGPLKFDSSLERLKSALSAQQMIHHPDTAPTKTELARYKQAKQLTRAGQHAEAEALLVDLKGQGYHRFFSLSSRRRKRFNRKITDDPRLGDGLNEYLRDRGGPLREDALFLLAENQFQQKKYATAQDNFAELLHDFPSTRHVADATARLFEIGRYWLDGQHFEAAGMIRPVGATAPLPGPAPESTRGWLASLPILPNVIDPTRPLFDTRGRALKALKTIWLTDPTGPLADDALVLSAAAHFQAGDTREADRIFTNLRQLYPDSPYLEPAFLLGSHIRLLGYQGAAYDETPLEEAEQLIKSTLVLYPEVSEKERLQEQLDNISNAMANREWERVRFYQKKNLPKSVAVHLNKILAQFPRTPHAARAMKMLHEMGSEYASGKWIRQELRRGGNPVPEPEPVSRPSMKTRSVFVN